eukprot:s1031_g9.t1
MAGVATLLSVKTWPQRYVSLRNNPSGTVSGWDGDPGPAGHLIFQEREGHYLISTEQFPRSFFRLVKEPRSIEIHRDPSRSERLMQLRAEPGDPGNKGHFLLNRKIPQESEGPDGLPAIIQTMYLIHNKDREHAAAMALLSNQKEEVRAREVAVLQAQMTSERAASEATLHDTNREHEEACAQLHQQMERERQTATEVLEEQDRNHAEDSFLQKNALTQGEELLGSDTEDQERASATATMRQLEQEHAQEVEALNELHKDELDATVKAKDTATCNALESLHTELEAARRHDVAELRKELEEDGRIRRIRLLPVQRNQVDADALMVATKSLRKPIHS